MNKIFKVVWSKARNCYVVVSEVAKANGKSSVKSIAAAVAVAVMMSGGTALAADISQDAEKTIVVHGIGNYDGVGNTNPNASKDKSWTLGDKTLWVDQQSGNQAGWSTYAVATDRYTFVGDENSTLKIGSATDTKLGNGLGIAGSIDVGDLSIDVQTYGISSYGKTTVTADNVDINAGYIALRAAEGGSIQVKAKESMNITGAAASVFAQGGADSVEIASYGANKADINVKGDIYSNGKVDLKLETKDSSFTGAVLKADSAKVNVTLDNGATWNVTDDSTLTGLEGKDGTVVAHGSAKAADNVTVTINNASQYYYANHVLKDTTVEFEGVDLVVNSATTGGDTMGMLSNAHIKSDSAVSINQTGNDAALGYFSDDSIEAKTINIDSEGVGAYAVYAANATDKHVLTADEINIDSNGRSIFNQDGNIDITAGELTVTSDRSAENKANNAITANGKGAVNVNADKVTLVGGIDVLNTNDAEVNFKSADGSSAPQTIQITGNINAKVGKLTGMSLDGEDSFIEGTINTDGNANAVISLSNGATWTATGKSVVNTLAGQNGTIAVEKAEKGFITIQNNQTQDLALNVADGDLGVDVEKGLDAMKNTIVDGQGNAVIEDIAVEDFALKASVEDVDGIVTTTIKPGDNFVVESNVEVKGDVKAGDVSLQKTASDLQAEVDGRKAADEVIKTALDKKVDNNATGLNAIALGKGAVADKLDNLAIGEGATSTGVMSVALGTGVVSSGQAASIAIGGGDSWTGFTTASNSGTVAIGYGAQATGYGSIALGGTPMNGAVASHKNAVAIGSGSVTGQDNSVSFGSAGDERVLQNVAAGTLDTDAANVGQLNAAIATEKARAEGVESGLNTRVSAIEGDYLKAADKTELQDKINTAKQEAINTAAADATSKANQALTDAKADATSKANAAKDAAIAAAATDATAKADKALTDAKAYTDTKVAGAINTAAADATAKADKALADAKADATSKANAAKDAAIAAAATDATTKADKALTDAKAYTDTKVAGAINTAAADATSKANQALADAKAYADTAKDAAVTAANSYTDAEIDKLETAIGNVNSANTQAIAGEAAARAEADAKLQSQVDANKQAIALGDRVNQDQNTQIAQLQSKDIELGNDIAQNASDIAANKQAIAGEVAVRAEADAKLQSQVDANKANIALNDRVNQVQNTQIAQLQSKDIELGNDIAQNASDIAANKQAIAGEAAVRAEADAKLQSQVDANKQAIALGDRVNQVQNTQIAQLQSKDIELGNDIAQNASDIAANTGNIQKNTTDIAELDTRVDAIESDIGDAKGKINEVKKALDDNVADLQSKDITLGNDIAANQQAIADEAKARQDSDANLQSQVDANKANIALNDRVNQVQNTQIAQLQSKDIELGNAISAETAARENADKVLQSQVDANKANIATNTADIATNKAAIDKNADAIVAEATAREKADQALQSQVDVNKANISLNDRVNQVQNTQIAQLQSKDIELGNAIADETAARKAEDAALQSQIDTNAADIVTNKTNIAANAAGIQQNANAIAGLNQNVARLDGRMDKVGAGAAALAALHPLDYDAENKLSFSAGVGNYAGQTAAAVGAFYRPNEDVMISIGGTAGNGENMVNAGVSFAIGKGSSGVAKMSKAELVQEVTNMKAENEELKQENKDIRHELNKLKELVMKLAEK